MKKIFGFALMMAIVAGGFTANAQTPNTPKKDKTEQCDRKDKKDHKDGKDKKDRKDRKDGKECQGRKDCKHFKDGKEGQAQHKRHNKGQRPDLFAGITLTQDQQSKLDALKAEGKAQHKAEKSEFSKEDRQARREAFNAKVKEILTPEQWTVYQQNVDKMKANRKQKKG